MTETLQLANLEDAVARQTQRKRTETAILGSIALAGFLTAACMAPNAVQILQKMVPDVRPLSQKQSVRRAIGRLIKHGYIKKDAERYHLTVEGTARLHQLLATVQSMPKKMKRWDKKWRIVIFDIKETQRAKRDELRSLLIQAGFVMLQGSVWVYPHRCDEVIALLKFHLKLGWNLIYIIADAIEDDDKLRKHFNLPQN